jgi:hypothetical protein
MNLGYMVIVLSNIAMLYLMYREQGMNPPEALFHHVKDLWQRVKMMTFSDGRLMRVGGDTRVRYCYCQDYAIPMWLMMTEWLGDPDATLFEQGWLGHVERETVHNGMAFTCQTAAHPLRRLHHFITRDWKRIGPVPCPWVHIGAVL